MRRGLALLGLHTPLIVPVRNLCIRAFLIWINKRAIYWQVFHMDTQAMCGFWQRWKPLNLQAGTTTTGHCGVRGRVQQPPLRHLRDGGHHWRLLLVAACWSSAGAMGTRTSATPDLLRPLAEMTAPTTSCCGKCDDTWRFSRTPVTGGPTFGFGHL